MIIAYFVIGSIIFIALVYLVYSLIEARVMRRSRVRKRMDAMAHDGSPDMPPETAREGFDADEVNSIIAKVMSNRGFTDQLMVQLTRAGVKLRPSEFVAISFMLGALCAAVLVFTTRELIFEVLGMIFGGLIPYVIVKMLEGRRLAMFNRQLPDALALISSAIRSGYSFQRAMLLVSDEMPDPICEEFKRALDELQVGLPTDIALMRMVNRAKCYDLELVVTAVIIQQQIGGNLAEIMDNISMTIRERVKLQGELDALTAEGKFSGIILVLLPFVLAIILSIQNPTYMEPLYTDQIGKMLIAGGVIAIGLGAFWIKQMLVLDY